MGDVKVVNLKPERPKTSGWKRMLAEVERSLRIHDGVWDRDRLETALAFAYHTGAVDAGKARDSAHMRAYAKLGADADARRKRERDMIRGELHRRAALEPNLDDGQRFADMAEWIRTTWEDESLLEMAGRVEVGT